MVFVVLAFISTKIAFFSSKGKLFLDPLDRGEGDIAELGQVPPGPAPARPAISPLQGNALLPGPCGAQCSLFEDATIETNLYGIWHGNHYPKDHSCGTF